MGAPENFNGRQGAGEGEGYAGFYAYAPDDYREYLQVPLLQPLEKDRSYKVSFWVSLSERSDFAVEGLGVLFAREPLRVRTKKNLAKKHWYAQAGNQYRHRDRQIDHEDPAPVGELDEHAAQRRAERSSDGARGHPE